ncbi:phosphonate ABC transporter ATP-binding protein [Paenibacillus sp. CN-4]|uniref:phosphonate ABC transporter ATP-binding protein n=1 Tax=Paenibacillus nanchangensis TaxID=3348343 RepID=UPI00397E2EFF
MIKVDGLAKSVGVDRTPVLKRIDAVIHKGEFVAIIGGSGSGKSTLLRCLGLREKWDDGKLIVEGKDVLESGFTGKLKLRREWAYLEQSPQLYMNKTALKNVLIGQSSQTPVWRMVTGMVRSDDYMGAMDELDALGLLDKAKLKASQLSGGERQRVAIARALVHGAKMILADEPVTGLDPKSAESVMETLKKLCEETGLIVVTVIPLELAERFASRIWVLEDGRIKHDVYGRRLTAAEKRGL